MESVLVGHFRQHAHNRLTAARGGVPALTARLHQIRAGTRYSDETKRQQVATAISEDVPSIRGPLEEVRGAAGRHLENADARIESVRAVDPAALSDRREALRPFLDRAFEDRSLLLSLYRNNFGDPAARRVIEQHVELFTGSGLPEATAIAEEWRGLQEEFGPQRSPEELQALEDRAALGEIQDYLDDGLALVNIDLAGLQQNGELSAQQLMDRPFVEARINDFESKFGLPSSRPGAMRPEQLLGDEEVLG